MVPFDSSPPGPLSSLPSHKPAISAPYTPPPTRFAQQARGAALVLVISLCGLLSLTLTAFLLLSTQSQTIAHTSTQRLQNQLAARFAQALLLADLRQEIRAGSFPVPAIQPALAPPLLYPATPHSQIPSNACKHPVPPPNLLKQSAYNIPFFPETALFALESVYPSAPRFPASNRASDCSTLNPARDGRRLTSQRWNTPALLPRAQPKSTSDPTPARSGILSTEPDNPPWEWSPPDWILLQADGRCCSSPNFQPPASTPPSGSASDTSRSNLPDAPIRHRFAYQLYDLGGLLDLNLAGYDPTLCPPQFASRRGSLGWCDLRELGLPNDLLADLAQWRHSASFPQIQTATWALSYQNLLQKAGRHTGFLRVPGILPALGAPIPSKVAQASQRFQRQTQNQAFTSRQTLLHWVQSWGGSPAQKASLWNSLQYLSHFSRSLEQPCFLPGAWNPRSPGTRIRPRIVPPAHEGEISFDPRLSPPDRLLAANYRGGNDGAGGDELLNPGPARVRVENPFLRILSGQFARRGEPLLKHRFPLTRLAWIQPEGPSASLPKKNPRHDPEGTPEAIHAAFGLRWNPLRENWVYDHGVRSLPSGHNPGVRIATLPEIASLAREADFFELLKTGIQGGSLGKAAALDRTHSPDCPATPLDAASYSQLRDRSIDLQILQIGANLLDQADPDSFPTQIEIFNRVSATEPRALPPQTIRGIEDLPYFFRLHLRGIADAQSPPNPWPAKAHPSEITEELDLYRQFSCGSTSLLALPEIWNPHSPPNTPSPSPQSSPQSSPTTSSAAPTLPLRCVAVSEDPDRSYALGSPNWCAQSRFKLQPATAFAALSNPEEGARVFFDSRWPEKGDPPSLTNRLARQSGFWRDLYAVEWPLPASGRANYQVLCFPLFRCPSRVPTSNFPWQPERELHVLRFAPRTVSAPAHPTVFALRESGVESLHSMLGPTPVDVQVRGSELLFELSNPNLFREPTTLCKPDHPVGSQLRAGPGHWFWSKENPAPKRGYLPETVAASSPSPGTATPPSSSTPPLERWLGFPLGERPTSWIVASQVLDATGTPIATDSYGWDPENGPRENSPFVQGPKPSSEPSQNNQPSEAGPGYGWFSPKLLGKPKVGVWRFFHVLANGVTLAPTLFTLRLQYRSPFSGQWITYDERYLQLEGDLFSRMDVRHSPEDPDSSGIAWYPVDNRQRSEPLPWQHLSEASALRFRGTREIGYGRPCLQAFDPRTSRFGHPVSSAFTGVSFFGVQPFWPGSLPADRWTDPEPNPDGLPPKVSSTQIGPLHGAGLTLRSTALTPRQTANHLVPGGAPGAPLDPRESGWFPNQIWDSPNRRIAQPMGGPSVLINRNPPRFAQSTWLPAGQCANPNVFRPGWLSENRADPLRQYYADPDDIVRRASGAYAFPPNSAPNSPSNASPNPPQTTPQSQLNSIALGLPDSQAPSLAPRQNRPLVLNRPFRSVAEMSYAFRGTPWKQIDFFTPESADTALLDLFSASELEHPESLCAGKINLNTRQLPVLRALLQGALKDEQTEETLLDQRASHEVQAAAEAILQHTRGEEVWQGPLGNLSELCSRLLGHNLFPNPPAPGLSQTEPVYSYTIPPGRPDAGTWSYGGLCLAWDRVFHAPTDQKIQRRRESVLRALVDSGQTRVWNLFLDLIIQTGRYPPGTRSTADFAVEAESRHWICWAIDRLTGSLLEEQIEPVLE